VRAGPCLGGVVGVHRTGTLARHRPPARIGAPLPRAVHHHPRTA
jgi:hypothetical protein